MAKRLKDCMPRAETRLANRMKVLISLGDQCMRVCVCAHMPAFIPIKHLYCILNLRILFHDFFSMIKQSLHRSVRCCYLTGVLVWFCIIPLFTANVWEESLWIFLPVKHSQVQCSQLQLREGERGQYSDQILCLKVSPVPAVPPANACYVK